MTSHTSILRDPAYRRLWLSVLLGSFGAQITLLALPLTAAIVLHATPAQMGWLTAMEALPFALFSLPSGVWLDRVRKLPVLVAGDLATALALAAVPAALWLGFSTVLPLYFAAFVIGCVQTVAGSASHIVLTHLVARDRLIQAYAKNSLAHSTAEVGGPGSAAILLSVLSAPLALLANASLLLASALLLRGLPDREPTPAAELAPFRSELTAGLRFVFGHRLLVALALSVGGWQFCVDAALAVQILYATNTLALSGQAVSLCFAAAGGASLLGSTFADRVIARIGPGLTLTLGIGLSALSWSVMAASCRGPWAAPMLAAALAISGAGAIFVFITFLGLRQAATPPALMGRMTSTMRWLIQAPAVPGALWGGWLGQHTTMRTTLLAAATGAAFFALLAWRSPALRDSAALLATPEPETPAGDPV